MKGNINEIQQQIAQFNEKHDLDTDGQFRQLSEEVGELAEALNRGENVADEAADVIFVAWSIGLLEGQYMSAHIERVTADNLLKDTQKDGDKVTKQGSGLQKKFL